MSLGSIGLNARISCKKSVAEVTDAPIILWIREGMSGVDGLIGAVSYRREMDFARH